MPYRSHLFLRFERVPRDRYWRVVCAPRAAPRRRGGLEGCRAGRRPNRAVQPVGPAAHDGQQAWWVQGRVRRAECLCHRHEGLLGFHGYTLDSYAPPQKNTPTSPTPPSTRHYRPYRNGVAGGLSGKSILEQSLQVCVERERGKGERVCSFVL